MDPLAAQAIFDAVLQQSLEFLTFGLVLGVLIGLTNKS
jgi:hypothetical protein